MAPNLETPNSIDKKLHRIALEAKGTRYPTLRQLADQISDGQFEEFSYQTSDGTEYASAGTIASYCTLARALGVLTKKLDCARDKGDIRAIANFQSWLGDLTLRYVNAVKASTAEIEAASLQLLTKQPRVLPTITNLHEALNTGIGVGRLKHCLQILALLKPKLIAISSRRLYLDPNVFKP